jgi:hypothetical protein
MQTSRIPSILAATSILLIQPSLANEEAPVESTPANAGDESSSPDPTIDLPLSTDLPERKDVAPPTPTGNATINLINRLVQKGILTQAEAAEMIQQAEADAAKVAGNTKAEAPPLPAEPSPEEEATITYIPEVVRNQMRDQIQQELLAQAREEKWSEKVAPDWTSKFRLFGDIRVRSENTMFPETKYLTNDNGDYILDSDGNKQIIAGNINSGAFPNFNSINTGAPWDEMGITEPAMHNVDQDRHRTRLRARVGTDVSLGDGFNAGVRIATGESNSPTSPNQTLGASGGNFSKYSLWLDRAFISYDAGPGDGEELTFLGGRFDNPFMSTEIMWDEDIGFDGLALRGKVRMTDEVSTFFTGGYFPVYNTDFNFASNQTSKFESADKWLSGAQFGIEWKMATDVTAKLAVSYYNFNNVEGKLSSPVITPSANEVIPMKQLKDGSWTVEDNFSKFNNTDSSRPSFAQRGNTYIKIRNIINSPFNSNGSKDQYQYYGLASKFKPLSFNGKIDYDGFDDLSSSPIRISLIGEVIKNTAFDVNNETAIGNRGNNNNYEGGDEAWNLAFIVGNPALESFGDWQASLGYRYVESDAVLDAFADSDFGGGGTNVKGFTVSGTMALSKAVRCSLRWMSADEVAGPPLSSDILQVDLNAKF